MLQNQSNPLKQGCTTFCYSRLHYFYLYEVRPPMSSSYIFEILPSRAVESESEGFSTWGVGVVENFNDSDSGQTFCSPIVTVCATNVRKRHTWQFKQLDASTRDDHGYWDRRQRTNFHTFTQESFQISSVPWAHHATYTLWMQPFGACITEISVCSFWLALSLLRDVGYATANEFSWELVHCYVTHVTEQW